MEEKIPVLIFKRESVLPLGGQSIYVSLLWVYIYLYAVCLCFAICYALGVCKWIQQSANLFRSLAWQNTALHRRYSLLCSYGLHILLAQLLNRTEAVLGIYWTICFSLG